MTPDLVPDKRVELLAARVEELRSALLSVAWGGDTDHPCWCGLRMGSPDHVRQCRNIRRLLGVEEAE
jgi:hypothetical protein